MKKIFSAGIALPLLLVLLAGCKKTDDATPPVVDVPKADLALATSTNLGTYLTTKTGQALYFFGNDADGANTCTGGCESLWPPFYTDLATAKLDAGLSASDFAGITTLSGKNQLTYKGYPLYTYAPVPAGGTANTPEASGLTGGDGIGGVWFVAKPDYTLMIANKQLTGADGNNYKSDYTVGVGKTAYFTDGKGRTLYVFTPDSLNTNKYTKPDFSNNATWPIYEETKMVVPSSLNKTLFGSINVYGKSQMTYKGWPLYYFVQDTQRGLNKGVSVPKPGLWPVVFKDIADPKKK